VRAFEYLAPTTVGEAVAALARKGDRGRPLPAGIMATVDGKRALRGLQHQVVEESEIRFLPVMAGG